MCQAFASESPGGAGEAQQSGEEGAHGVAYGVSGTLPEMAALTLAVGITWRINYTEVGDSTGDKMRLKCCTKTMVERCRWMAFLSRAVVLNPNCTSKFPGEFFLNAGA